MNRTDIVALIKRRLGRVQSTTYDDEIEAEITVAQETLERGIESPAGRYGTFLPWFLITEQQSISTTAHEERLILPNGFLRENESAALWRFDSADTDAPWKELAKDELDFLRNKFPEEGAPEAYVNLGDYFRLAPVPDAAYTIKIIIFGKDTELTATALGNKWTANAPLLLAAEAGLAMANNLRNNAANIFADMRTREIARLYTDTEARLHANRRYVMGGQD